MTWAWVLLIILITLICVLAIAGWRLWRTSDPEARRLVKRIARLPFRSKLRLSVAMMRDRRIPLRVRAIPPGLILYLAMPIDIIPDFLPVIGQLDDVIIVLVGVGLLFRFTPPEILEEHLVAVEAAAV